MGFWNFIRKDTRATVAEADTEHGPGQLTANGDLRVRDDDLNSGLMPTLTRAAIAGAGGTSATLITAVTGKALHIYGLMFSLDAAGTVTFKSATTDLTGIMLLPQATPFILFSPHCPVLVTASAAAFVATLSAGANLNGWVLYKTV